MSYISIAIVAYLLFAGNAVIDKFLLKKSIPDPTTYAFYIGILSLIVFVLGPFGLIWPGGKILFLALVSGALFTYALVAFYKSLKEADSSHVLPVQGALVPIFTFFLSYLLVGERLSWLQGGGLVLLIFGSVFITWGNGKHAKNKNWITHSLLAAFLFAASFSLSKSVYNQINFVSGLIWTRTGLTLGALAILLLPSARHKIFHTTRSVRRPIGFVFMGGQTMAAVAGVLQNLAISLGSVTLVNALQGTQFAFLLLLTYFVSRKFPKILQEDFSKQTLAQKIIGVVLIAIGLVLVA